MSEPDYDPLTGEVLEKAVDGRPLAPVASTLSSFIRGLEDGQLDLDAAQAMRDLMVQMREVAIQSGGKSKGKFTLTLSFALEGGTLVTGAEYKATPPSLPRARSVGWPMEDGRISFNPIGQGSLFGRPVKSV